MRCLLHRAIHFNAPAEDAEGEASRSTLRSSDGGEFVRPFRAADATDGVRGSTTGASHVWDRHRGRAEPAYFTGDSDSTTSNRWPIRSRFVLR